MTTYQATLKDLAGVSKLFNAYRMFYQQATDMESARQFIQERLDKQDSIIFVVKEAGEYKGFTQLYPSFSSVAMKRVWILNDLFVDPGARKQGIAEKLLQEAKAYAKETGAKSIALKTAPDNTIAKQLYDKHGYKQDTLFDHYELLL